MPLASQSPYPIMVYSATNYRPILVTFVQKRNFRDPDTFTLYLCIYPILNEEHFTFHLQYKYSGTFANRKYEELSYPKNQKMCDPILVTLLKMRPHYSQSSCENATSSGGTSQLASYKEVPKALYFNFDWLLQNHFVRSILEEMTNYWSLSAFVSLLSCFTRH